MKSNEINEALSWRYATKSFNKDKKISDGDWKTLASSLVNAPSSYGLQPWKFFVIQTPELRTQLRAKTWNQSQVTDCSHYVVFTAKAKLDQAHIDQYLQRIQEVRGVTKESLEGYRTMMSDNLLKGPRSETIHFWAQRQAYIAMGFLLETAAMLNIDACPIEGLEPAEYDRILNLKNTGWETVATVALGYRSAEDAYQKAAKVRFKEESVIEFR